MGQWEECMIMWMRMRMKMKMLRTMIVEDDVVAEDEVEDADVENNDVEKIRMRTILQNVKLSRSRMTMLRRKKMMLRRRKITLRMKISRKMRYMMVIWRRIWTIRERIIMRKIGGRKINDIETKNS